VLSFVFSMKDIQINVRYFPNTLGIFSKCFRGKISNRGQRYVVGLAIGGESILLVYCSLHLEFLLIVAFSGIKTIFSLSYICSKLLNLLDFHSRPSFFFIR
jgi:hypothetical protein